MHNLCIKFSKPIVFYRIHPKEKASTNAVLSTFVDALGLLNLTGKDQDIPEAGLEPARLAASHFECDVSAIPPLGHVTIHL